MILKLSEIVNLRYYDKKRRKWSFEENLEIIHDAEVLGTARVLNNENDMDVQLEVFDNLGRMVWKGKAVEKISTGGWSSGVYHVNGRRESKNYYGQLIIQ